MRRKLDLLRLIIEDADKARTPEERKKYLQEFLNKSEPFVTEYPNDAQIWLLRGAAAVELCLKVSSLTGSLENNIQELDSVCDSTDIVPSSSQKRTSGR